MEVKCQCGAYCWAHNHEDYDFGDCGGEMYVSEDYPGEYVHFCDKHGHFEDIVYSEWPERNKVE
jgi:hypothetical protein